MITTAKELHANFNAIYTYTESDEISLLLNPQSIPFKGSVEKLVSVSAGISSAAFTLTGGKAAHFDSRIWIGATAQSVIDYFMWRQSDASRCAINGWCYWTLRDQGESKNQATQRIHGRTISDKNELLFTYGINFNDIPLWQRRGIGILWENYERKGFDPMSQIEVTTTRRHLAVNDELPTRDAYMHMLEGLLDDELS